MNAPYCPVSYSSVSETGRVAQYAKLSKLKDKINSIPRAHDLPSVINALNIISSVITEITHNAPMINNVHPTGLPSVILKGDDFNPHYEPADWFETGRVYDHQELVNPDNNDQFIPISTLSQVSYQNPNGASLTFYSTPA
jgi:hypothetical protein